jgi:signal transduction histidine kinase
MELGSRRTRGGLLRRAAVASVVLAALIGAAFTRLLVAVEQLRASVMEESLSGKELDGANQLEVLVLEMENGLRRFVTTRRGVSLEPFDAAQTAFAGDIAALERHEVNARQAARLRAIGPEVAAYISGYARPLIAAVRRGSPSARSFATTEVGRRRIDAIQAHLDAYRTTQLKLLDRRKARDTALAQQAVVVSVAGLAGSIVLVFLFGAYLARALVLPVRRVAGMARRLADGDLDVRVPETGAGETRALAETFNSMAGSLQVTRDDLRLLVDEQSALRRVATQVAHGVSPVQLFNAVAGETLELTGADSARLCRYEGDGSATVVADHSKLGAAIPVGTRLPPGGDTVAVSVWQTGHSSRQDYDIPTGATATHVRERGLRSAVGAPIVVEGGLWGVIIAYWSRTKAPSREAETRMAEFAELVATAIANANSREELIASRARVLGAADEARRRVVRDLHDGAQQRLVHAIIGLKLAQRALVADPAKAKPLIADAIMHAEQANVELRELAHGTFPAILAQGGLEAGVDALTSRLRVPVKVEVATPRLAPGIEASAYFIIAEALTNVVKHSHAQEAEVSAHVNDGHLQIEVRDNGIGGAQADGTGLRGLEDRVVALGGEFRVQSAPGAGTVVAATIPIPI